MNPQKLGQLWVALQFGLLLVLAGLCVLEAQHSLPGVWSVGLWLASAVLGLWTLWVNRPGNFNIRPEPHPDGHLVQEGPYRWVRHPMYGAVLLLAAGAAAWLANALGVVLWLALLAVLLAKTSLEKQWLLKRYPQYANYRLRTWLDRLRRAWTGMAMRHWFWRLPAWRRSRSFTPTTGPAEALMTRWSCVLSLWLNWKGTSLRRGWLCELRLKSSGFRPCPTRLIFY